MKPKINRLFIDIETSPNVGLFWSAGWKQSIGYENIIKEREVLCVCFKWEHEKQVHGLYVGMPKNKGVADERDILVATAEILELADEIVAHNGDKFDIPWLRTRCLFHGVNPFEVKSIDTLQWARRKFRFNSNRLDYIGKFLGVGGKIKTEYGLWKDIVLKNCPRAMDKMVRYCKRDVKMLQEVYQKLADYQKPKTHVGVLNGSDKWTSPFTGGTNVHGHGKRVTAAGTVQHRMKCLDSSRPYAISVAAFNEYQEWRKLNDKRLASNKA